MFSKIINAIPITKSLQDYSKKKAYSDLIAGITVGLTVLPQGLAYATLAGLEPQFGLYSAFMGCFVYAIFGGCREVTIGPTALLSLMTAKYTSRMAGVEFAVLLCFLTGCIQFLMAIFRMGLLVNLISMPVSIGFTSATAVIIATSQVNSLLGLQRTRGSSNSFGKTVINIWNNVPNSKLGDCLLGGFSIILLLFLRKLKDIKHTDTQLRWKQSVQTFLWLLATSRNALVVLCGAFSAYCFENWGNSVPFALTGHVRSGLPTFKVPSFGLMKEICNITVYNSMETGNNISSKTSLYKSCEDLKNLTIFDNKTVVFNPDMIKFSFVDMVDILGSSIILVPIIGVLGNIAICKAFGSPKLNPSRELIALSLSNIFGSFFNSMPVTGSFSRSAVNHASGVQTPIGGVYTGLLVLLAIGILAPYFHYIPKSSLAAVVICAVLFMIEYEVIKPLWRCSRRELFGCMKTFLLSLIFSVEVGLIVGVSWDLLYVIYRAARPALPISNATTQTGLPYILIRPGHSLLYFPAVDFLRKAICKAVIDEAVPIIIDCSFLHDIDFTAARGMLSLSNELCGRLFLFKANEGILKIIEDANNTKAQLKNAKDDADLLALIEYHYVLKEGIELKNMTSPLLKCESIVN